MGGPRKTTSTPLPNKSRSLKKAKVEEQPKPSSPGFFPRFNHGTVEIHLSDASDDLYKLHRAVLTRNSIWFARQITKIDQQHSTDGIPNKYVFVLSRFHDTYFLEVSEDPSPPRIDLTGPDENSDAETTDERQEKLRAIEAHREFFSLLYNRPSQMSSSDIELAFVQSSRIISLADFYESQMMIRPVLCAKLCEFRHSLFTAIAHDPPKWLNLSICLQSGLIFAEASIHCIGGFPAYPWPTSLCTLSPDARKTVHRKASQLMHWRTKVDNSLLTNTLLDEKGSPVSILSGTESWFVVNIFRDWLRHQMQGPHTIGDWQSNGLYKKLSLGAELPLSVDEIKQLLANVDGLKAYDFENVCQDLTVLQKYAAKEVAPLLKNRLSVDAEATGIPYLICMDVKFSDYPWS